MLRCRLALLTCSVLAAGGIAATVPSAEAAPPAASSAASRLDGFTSAHSSSETAAEKKFMSYPSASLARELDKQLANRTGMVGTANDHRRALMIADRMRQFGLTPKINTYYVYMSSPKHISVEVTSPIRKQLPNKEACRTVETDCQDVVVGYNALSPSGDVTAPVVYVNYGTTEDYATLARAGVSVKGKIVLARYGAVYRGVKTNLAAEHGAKGVVIYSDPKDDGNTNGPVYPNGPWRAPDGIQRGSVQQLWQYGGDPLTPGRPATKDARRISPKDANIAKIPTTPISYSAAQPILQHLGGATAPSTWQGGLPLTYRLGSGSTVHLNLQIDYRVRPVYDVTATIRGNQHPDEIVAVGGHHDAWTYGSDDNLSGAEAVLQIGRAMATLQKTGWKPARTVQLHTWDGEEYGLFGSTEYAEDQGRQGNAHVVGYLNMDGAGGETFGASSVPSMDRVIRDVTRTVPWPGTNGTAYDNWAASQKATTPTPERLGSGSDYTAFLDHFGVPSSALGSGTPSGNYHCACDNFYMEDHFIDPTWRYHVSTAQVVGLVAMRLADADVIPLHYTPYATEVGQYLNELSGQQDDVFGQQKVDLDRDKRAAAAWARAASSTEGKIDALLAANRTGPQLDALTQRLERVERQLLVPAGLPGRPWYQHQIYAPGVNQGYGTQELPAINDALFLRANVAEARRYEGTLFSSLRTVTHTLGGS